MELIISTLLAAFAYLDGLRTKKQLLAAINSSYVDRLEEAINNLQTQDQQLLKDLQQELIQKALPALLSAEHRCIRHYACQWPAISRSCKGCEYRANRLFL